MDPEESGHWFQWRVQELVRSLQQAGSGRGRDRDRDRERERARTAPATAASLAGRLRQFAQQQPPRLRRLFSGASASSSASASAPASAPGSPLRRQERDGAGDAPPPDTAPPVLERPATAASVAGGEPAVDGAGPEASLQGARPALTLTPASAPCRDERAGPQEPAGAAAQPHIQADESGGDGDGVAPALAMDVTELEPAAGESASASIDGEVPSIVLEPASAPTASQEDADADADGTDSPSRAPAKGPSDEEADLEDGAELDRQRQQQAAPRLSLSLQPEAEAAAAHRKSPVTVQEWVDSLPGPEPATRNEEDSEELPIEDGEEALDLGLGAEAGLLYNGCPPVTIVSPSQPCLSPTAFGAVSEVRLGRQKEISPGLVRESSVQSDVTSHGSHGSSVDSFLESRKPDPEEVLLNLGFGGPPIAENEVSRIPRRFLQPSKVKGVAIDDFLRYQQDLIENFETGFCGYRGLTGSSHTPPSVIVAKIREKLRSSHSLCTSLSQSEEGASSLPGALSLSVPASAAASACASAYDAPRRRFSRAARRVLRDLPQDSHLSVLTPDNRRFLENQGRNKSPDVPRKRIVFGERSFTFAGDGDLVEVQPPPPSPPLPQQSLPQPPPLADMAGRARPRPLLHKDSVLSSATSLSMTSLDSDSDTDEGSYERRLHNPQPHRPTFVPVTQSSPNAEPPSQTLHTVGNMTSDSDSSVVHTVSQRPRFSKRISSTSISSWESESPHTRFYLSSPTFDSPTSSRPVRYESIDEDVEMTFSDTVESSAEGMGEQNETNQKPHDVSEGNKEITADTEVDVFDNSGNNDTQRETINAAHMNVEVETVSVSEIPPPCASGGVGDVHSVKSDKERLLLRRSSLKRQNRVVDEDLVEYENSNSVRKTDDTLPVLKFTSHEADNIEENFFGKNGNSMEREGSQETLVASPKLECPNVDMNDVVQPIQSQFLDPITGVRKCTATPHADQLTMTQQDEPPSASFLSASPATADESFEMEELMTCDEETNGAPLTLARTRSDSSGFLEGERSPPPQAPPTDAGLSTSDADTHPPPIGGCVNKFSSCSDESVVHVPSRDLRELLDELAGRGLQLPDSASFACQMGSEQQVEAVRMALETYSEQLECGSRTKMLDTEGAAELLRKQIAAELRHVATLLEEQPGSQAAAAITRQVTALLREQTRLCRQLETLTGCNVEAINSATDPNTSALHCCCESERMLDAVREENRRLERLVEAHSAELAEIRQMLSRLIDRERNSAAL